MDWHFIVFGLRLFSDSAIRVRNESSYSSCLYLFDPNCTCAEIPATMQASSNLRSIVVLSALDRCY